MLLCYPVREYKYWIVWFFKCSEMQFIRPESKHLSERIAFGCFYLESTEAIDSTVILP